jgi:hypothetical protein
LPSTVNDMSLLATKLLLPLDFALLDIIVYDLTNKVDVVHMDRKRVKGILSDYDGTLCPTVQ